MSTSTDVLNTSSTRVNSALSRRATDESACTPDFVRGDCSPLGGHPSRPAVAGRLVRPTRRLGRAALERLRRPGVLRHRALLGLAPGGVYRATPVTRGAGGLLPHRFTLTGTRPAVCSLWHFPAGHPGLPLATTLLCGVRTFLGDTSKGADATAQPTRPSRLILRQRPGPVGRAARGGRQRKAGGKWGRRGAEGREAGEGRRPAGREVGASGRRRGTEGQPGAASRAGAAGGRTGRRQGGKEDGAAGGAGRANARA
ncbi:hypothetical protein CLV70_14421 [Pseudosporangium ferrugineum]|uniref:Uncharacterized protein n=1 Tax=Pseudosporangium ferrugineum TaxID=439699 RepID=A0A2T0RC97_9ACTN|nr:hypothetical protein CLV70_14421 [Pseudosporangium ferrugineum]